MNPAGVNAAIGKTFSSVQFSSAAANSPRGIPLHGASVQFADESRRRAAGRLSVVPAVTDTEAGWVAASAPARPG